MTTFNASALNRVWDTNVKIETILHIGSMSSDCTPDVFDEFISDVRNGRVQLKSLKDGLPWLEGAVRLNKKDPDYPFLELFLDEARVYDTLGFLVQVGSPVYDNEKDYYSWGLRNVQWFYGETYAQAFNKAEKWARKRQNDYHKAREKFRKEKVEL